jgi:CDP-glucose 4,6-dehydratase
MLGMRCFGDVYRGKRVLLTGHTGFKGSWLALWLSELGAKLEGLALDPITEPNHWSLIKLPIVDHRLDIRDFASTSALFDIFKPEIVFHLAAQPLVRRSYQDPIETWSTNVMGTAHILEACRLTSNVKAVVVVTTDKCYENREWAWGYRETDTLGGRDPYSASKAGSELVVASYRSSYFMGTSQLAGTPHKPLLATARAGNVIGGGDWSQDRLVPDMVRAFSDNTVLSLRSPSSTRPWQHVLESLSGYLLLGQLLFEGKEQYADAWNLGPEPDGNRSVAEVVAEFCKYLPHSNERVSILNQVQPYESNLLYLDCARARRHLGWKPVWNFQKTIEMTATWYSNFSKVSLVDNLCKSVTSLSRQQIAKYVEDSYLAKSVWVS